MAEPAPVLFVADAAASTRDLLTQIAWFNRLRVFAAAGVIWFTALATHALGVIDNPWPLYSLGGLIALVDGVYMLFLPRLSRLPLRNVRRHVLLQITIDLVILTALLHFTGGATNPLVSFYIFHAFIAALVLCLATWLIIEKTRLGAYLRAATERAELVQAFGVNVPRMVTLTYGFGVALAAVGGVLAAPIYSVNPQMGSNLIIVVFAVVVIGGMGSILGAILTGFALGVVEGLTKVFWPEASATVIFVIMAIVLVARPAGLFGRA
jgi:branched-subunit amino acid ABC-type transport system permease component